MNLKFLAIFQYFKDMLFFYRNRFNLIIMGIMSPDMDELFDSLIK